MFFEVFVPSTGQGSDGTLQIDAPDWRRALNTAMGHYGISDIDSAGAHIELGETVIQFSSFRAAKTVTVRMLADSERPSQVLKSMSGSHAVAPAPGAPPPASASGPVTFKDRSTGRFRQIGASDISLHGQKPDAGVSGRILTEQRVSGAQNIVTPEEAAQQQAAENDPYLGVSDSALEDVFLEIPAIHEPGYATEDAIDFIVDLAMKYIPCTHGGVMFAEDTNDGLYFAAARGANSDAFLDAKIPIDKGLASVALRNGYCVAVGDAPSDPRYHGAIAEQTGVQEQSVVAAPIQYGQRAFGVLVLINRKGAGAFTQYDTNIVSYIANQMGEFIQRQVDAAPIE